MIFAIAVVLFLFFFFLCKVTFLPPKPVLDPYPALIQLSQVVLDGAGPTSPALIHLFVLF